MSELLERKKEKKNILVDANRLGRTRVQEGYINDHINDSLRMIAQKIRDARDELRHEVLVTIPVVYTVPSMTNATAMRLIHYGIMKDLKDNHYDIRYHAMPHTCVLKIVFASREDEEEARAQREFLRSITDTTLRDPLKPFETVRQSMRQATAPGRGSGSRVTSGSAGGSGGGFSGSGGGFSGSSGYGSGGSVAASVAAEAAEESARSAK